MLRADAESLYRGKHRDLSRRLNTETLGAGEKTSEPVEGILSFPFVPGSCWFPRLLPPLAAAAPGAVGTVGESSQGFLLREGTD